VDLALAQKAWSENSTGSVAAYFNKAVLVSVRRDNSELCNECSSFFGLPDLASAQPCGWLNQMIEVNYEIPCLLR